LELNIPVSDPDFWNFHSNKLAHVLGLLSGDLWSLRFRKFAGTPYEPTQSLLEFAPSGELTIAYSNGLDSFAVARLVGSGVSNLSDPTRQRRDLVLVTTGQTIDREKSKSRIAGDFSARRISVPFAIRRKGRSFQLRETSYRTRGFAFQTMAAIAAAQSEGDTVVIAESGQGSLGPWLTVTGQESPDVRSHPIFTSALSQVLEPVLGRRISFEHPQLWKTKGETLSMLCEANLHKGWERTFSCAIQVRHQQNTERHLQCGVCPNCLLRRQSLFAAGLSPNQEEYDIKCELNASSLRNSAHSSLYKRATQGILPLVELARVRSSPIFSKAFELQTRRLAHALNESVDVTFANATKLVDTHRAELEAFLRSLPNNSAIRELGEALS
jgi:7-cyano-7-deazaguanine synthase in queuosine biosynthesis